MQKFEGDMLRLTLFVGAMATALETLKRSSGGRPLELLRKESLAGLTSSAARKVLFHAYAAVVPACPLPGPPLPLLFSSHHPNEDPAASQVHPPPPLLLQPAYYGTIGEATSPWLQLLLYAEAKSGPPSLVLTKGQRLRHLPDLLEDCTHALVWPWHQASPSQAHQGGGGGGGGAQGCWASAAAAAASEGSPFVLLDSTFLLFMLNEALEQTAVMVQPIDGPNLLDLAAHYSAPGRPGGGGGLIEEADEFVVEDEEPFLLVDVPLPLQASPCRRPSHLPPSSVPQEPCFQSIERRPSGAQPRAMEMTLSHSVREAIDSMGLEGCPGSLRMILWPSEEKGMEGSGVWLPLCLSLGLPIYCLPLCQAVCANSELSGFLSDVGRERRGQGQDLMMTKLVDLIEELQGGNAWMVSEPSVNLVFDARLGVIRGYGL